MAVTGYFTFRDVLNVALVAKTSKFSCLSSLQSPEAPRHVLCKLPRRRVGFAVDHVGWQLAGLTRSNQAVATGLGPVVRVDGSEAMVKVDRSPGQTRQCKSRDEQQNKEKMRLVDRWRMCRIYSGSSQTNRGREMAAAAAAKLWMMSLTS